MSGFMDLAQLARRTISPASLARRGEVARVARAVPVAMRPAPARRPVIARPRPKSPPAGYRHRLPEMPKPAPEQVTLTRAQMAAGPAAFIPPSVPPPFPGVSPSAPPPMVFRDEDLMAEEEFRFGRAPFLGEHLGATRTMATRTMLPLMMARLRYGDDSMYHLKKWWGAAARPWTLPSSIWKLGKSYWYGGR